MRIDRIIVAVIACVAFLGLPSNVHAQQSAMQMPPNPYKQLDDLSINAKNYPAVEALYREIIARTFFGPLPDSITARMSRTEVNRAGVVPSPVTERSIADAVNYLGRYLGGQGYTGTNEEQVHLLRVAMYRNLPHLLRSPTPADPQKRLVETDLTPSGGAYMGLLLLRQKLANPQWFGDPDTQNKFVLSHTPPNPQARTHNQLRVETEPALATMVRKKLARDLPTENSATTAAFHRFLDIAGFDQ